MLQVKRAVLTFSKRLYFEVQVEATGLKEAIEKAHAELDAINEAGGELTVAHEDDFVFERFELDEDNETFEVIV